MKKAAPILLAVGLLAASVLYFARRDSGLRDLLPERTVTATLAQAARDAGWFADANQLSVVGVQGRGSMSADQYIPATPESPSQIVAYAVVDYSAPFDSIKVGDLCVYQPAWSKALVMHQSVALDPSGKHIMSGSANAHYENGVIVMGRDQFVGRVVKVFVSAQFLTP